MCPASIIDLDVPCSTKLEACAAASIRPSRLDNWFNREPPIILLRKNERLAKGLDQGQRLTLRRVYQIALAAELMGCGITAQRAGNVAAMFTDQGGEKPTHRCSNSNDARRQPGHLFPSGGTTLVANRDGKLDPIITAVVNAPLVEVAIRHKTGAVVVDVEEVVNRVLTSLRLTDQSAVAEIEPAILHGPSHAPAMMSGRVVF